MLSNFTKVIVIDKKISYWTKTIIRRYIFNVKYLQDLYLLNFF